MAPGLLAKSTSFSLIGVSVGNCDITSTTSVIPDQIDLVRLNALGL
jgi:hypothetical protein